MKKPINAFIVSHSHWDREWYLPFALMRNKLVILMDYLLDILATEPTFHKFVTDCQVSMLDDYLAVKPGARDCVKAALSKGQILAGPYYVPPNEWLINGEAYIRNLLLARRVLRDLGLPAPSCKAGYSPDSACSDFGHPLQVPQIWALSGLPLFVGRFAARGSDFWWEAPDGSRVHVCKLMAGYSNAADLSEDIDKGSKALIKAASEVAPRYLTPNILLFNGNDHLLPQKHIGHLIERANAVQDDFSFVQGSYEEYAKAVENATHGNMPVCSGEFMEGGSRENEGKMRKVNGYFSTRIYLKQANARCEQVLASYAEPFSALAWIVGGHEYPAAYLWEAWNWVVRNHHHDSVPGTSTDAVHRECMMRYTWAEQMGTGIAVKKLNELANHIKDIPPGLVEDNDRENAFLIAFNPHPWAYRGPVTFDLMDNWLYCAEPSVRLVPLCYAMTQVAPPAFFITDATGKQYPVSIEPILNDTGYKFNQGVKNALLSFVTELPPFGYKIFELHATEEPIHPPELALKVDPATNTMENDALKITVAANGTITLVDKRSGREFPGLLEVVDYGDRGDEYDQAPVRDPACNGGWSRVSSLDSAPEITWVETGSPRGRVDIKHVFKLPLRFPEANRVDHGTLENFPVMVSVRLFEQASRADVVIIMENNSKNHRVEARVPTGIPADHMQVDGAFCTATRTANFYQTAAMHRFIDVNDGKGGIAVLSRGLYEYNLDRKDDRTLIVDLTLLRCIGVLASHEIGNRWPANSVPEAQVLGPTIVEFALAGHTSDAVAGNVHRLAAEFCAPPRTIEPLEHLYLRGKCPKTLPAGEHSFLELSPSQLEFSALYKDDDKDIVYMRLYNTTSTPCEASIKINLGKPIREVTHVDFNGEAMADQQALKKGKGTITVQVRPAQIVTLAMKF